MYERMNNIIPINLVDNTSTILYSKYFKSTWKYDFRWTPPFTLPILIFIRFKRIRSTRILTMNISITSTKKVPWKKTLKMIRPSPKYYHPQTPPTQNHPTHRNIQRMEDKIVSQRVLPWNGLERQSRSVHVEICMYWLQKFQIVQKVVFCI